MKRMSTSELVPGMITAEDVYNYNNQLILQKGLILTDKAITKLEFYSIINVRVEDELAKLQDKSADVVPSYAERVKSSREFRMFQQEFEENVTSFRNSINDVVERGTQLNVDELLDQTMALVSNENGSVNIFDMLHNMRNYDDVTYVHCVNVALICNIFARWLRFNEEEIRIATLSGLFHDIGKLMIPDNIIRKPGKLTSQEYMVVKTHPQDGYRILCNQDLDSHIRNAALMHHERCDGSGYPLGLKAPQIDDYAKIVAIADVYDAMTSARIYRGPLCPFKVIAVFENEGLQKYDTRFILTFLENVVNTYLLNRVRLNNGVEGDIIYINHSQLSAPTIKCGNSYIDLSTEPGLSIESII